LTSIRIHKGQLRSLPRLRPVNITSGAFNSIYLAGATTAKKTNGGRDNFNLAETNANSVLLRFYADWLVPDRVVGVFGTVHTVRGAPKTAQNSSRRSRAPVGAALLVGNLVESIAL